MNKYITHSVKKKKKNEKTKKHREKIETEEDVDCS